MDTNELRPTSTSNIYDSAERRHREQLAFVENVCNVLIVERFDVETRQRPWQVFDVDIEEMFYPFSRYEMTPDAEFDLTNGEFAFARFASVGSALFGTQAGCCGSPHEVRAPFETHRTDRPLTPTVSTTLSRGSPESFDCRWLQPTARVNKNVPGFSPTISAKAVRSFCSVNRWLNPTAIQSKDAEKAKLDDEIPGTHCSSKTFWNPSIFDGLHETDHPTLLHPE